MPPDFSGKNLRGRSFKGQDLTGANFSYADIRGANFTNAKLIGANFSHAKAGLQYHWAIFWVTVSFLLAALLGFISTSTNGYAWWRIVPKTGCPQNEVFQESALIFSVVIVGLLLVFFLIAIWKGRTAGLTALMLTIVGLGAVATSGNTIARSDTDALFRWASAIASTLAVGVCVAGGIAGTVAVTGTVARSWTVAVIIPGGLIGGAVGALTRVLYQFNMKLHRTALPI